MKWEPIEGVTVIGVGHKARQGKDTIANYLVQHYHAQKFSFAHALYDVARVVFGMKEKDGPLLQVLGTDVFRKRDEDIWVKTLYYKLKDWKPKIVVVPDVRFPNEAQMVKDMGGFLIKVERYNPDGSRFVASDRPTTHPSETALDNYKDFDLTIKAKDGDFESIYANIEALMNDPRVTGYV